MVSKMFSHSFTHSLLMHLTLKKNVWMVFCRFIKTVCKFQNAMKDPRTRTEFELYLRMSYRHFSECKLSSVPSLNSVPGSGAEQSIVSPAATEQIHLN